MLFEGTVLIKAPREKVWDFLTNPNSIATCVPDVQQLEVESESKFAITVKAGVGFVKGSFGVRLEFLDKQPPSHARLVGRGSGASSTVDLDTTMDLSTTPDGGTNIAWKAEAKVGGLIAGVGQRLMRGTAEKNISRLFENLKKNIET